VTAVAPMHPELRAALDVLSAWIEYRSTFEMGADGRATSMKVGEHRRHRIAEW